MTETTNLHPWDVTTLEDFLYYCCPECDLKVKDIDFFYAHAVQNHSKAQKALTQQFDTSDDVTGDVTEVVKSDLIKQEVIQDEDYFIDSNVNIKSELELDSMDYEDSIQPEVELKELKNELKELKDEKLPSKVVTVHDWQCYLCGLQLKSKNDIMSHIRDEHKIENVTRWMYGEPRTHQCPECKLMFRSVDAYKLHICGPPPPFWFGINDSSCPKCDKKFKTYKELLYHYATVHTKERHFNCDFCDYSAVHPDHVRRHVRDMHKAGDFKCDKCDFQCESRITFRNHRLRHGDIIEYFCDVCDFKTTKHSALKSHQMKHEEPKFKCDTCCKTFHKQQTLKRHQTQHLTEEYQAKRPKLEDGGITTEQTFLCDKCDYTGKSIQALLSHQERVHLKLKPHMCDICGKSFYRPDKLKQHIKILHNEDTDGSNQYTCDKCGISYKWKTSLRVHMETHQKYHMCTLCEKVFIGRPAMKKHMQKEHQVSDKCENLFICSICSKELDSSMSLNNHLLSEHGKSNDIHCTQCEDEQRFASPLMLNIHMTEHHNFNPMEHSGGKLEIKHDTVQIKDKTVEKMYRCDTCGLFLKSTRTLHDHTRQKHQKETHTHFCDECDWSTFEGSRLKKHKSTMHVAKNFKCDKCPLAFKNVATLRNHVKVVHDKILPYQCSVCAKQFQQKHRLEAHYMNEHNIKYEYQKIETR